MPEVSRRDFLKMSAVATVGIAAYPLLLQLQPTEKGLPLEIYDHHGEYNIEDIGEEGAEADDQGAGEEARGATGFAGVLCGLGTGDPDRDRRVAGRRVGLEPEPALGSLRRHAVGGDSILTGIDGQMAVDHAGQGFPLF